MPTIEDIINIGFNKHQDGKLEDAEYVYMEALKLDNENAEICNLMGVLRLQQNNVDDAVIWVEKAINKKPCEYFYETLFQTYIRAGQYQKIINYESIVLEKYSKSFPLLFNIALAYRNLKQNKNAIKFYDKALKIDPSSYQAWSNLGHLYKIEGQIKNAVSALKMCNKIRPKDKETEYFYAVALMRAKDYDKGLKYFESRLCKQTAVSIQNKTYPNLASPDKLWRGENIKNKTLMVYYEAGYGDTIMFARYLPLLKKVCKKVIFYPQKPLVQLFNYNQLGLDEIIEGYIPEQNLDFDVHTPLLSLPYLLKIKGDKIFESSSGYLTAEKELIKEYKQKYFNNKKLKIGIKWQGNTMIDKSRVISPEAFLPLFDIKNTQFYSFQTFEGAENIEKINTNQNIIDVGKDLIEFNQTAAALANLDLVICNDTSLAHLAGAMGVPCFVMLPYEVNWRWHEGKGQSEWYNSIRLFRQKTQGDWTSVILDIKNLLESYRNND